MTFHEAISNLVESEEQLIEEHKSIIQADQLLLEEEQALLEYVDDVEHDIEGKFEFAINCCECVCKGENNPSVCLFGSIKIARSGDPGVKITS